MKLDELYLNGFGNFHQQTIGPFTEKITVLYGPNEAGKSTLLAFVRAALFGFPARFNQHYPPLAGGRHGGRVILTSGAGLTYTVERFAGARGGLSVLTPDGPASDAERLLHQLTGSATRDQFSKIFAFSLDELQEVDSLQGSSIYSAGQGAPGLPALQKKLSDGSGVIYRSKGSNQEVPKLLSVLKDVDEKLRAVEGAAGRYGGLTARKSEIDRELESSDDERSRLNAQLAYARSLLSGWDDWLELLVCEKALADVPRFEQFPEDPIPRLEARVERVRQANEDQQEAADQLRLTEEAASADIPGEDLLPDDAKIEGIRRSRGSLDNSVKDLPDRQIELRDLDADFAGKLRDLGQGWDEAQLDAFDTSLVVQNEIEQWIKRIDNSRERVQHAQSELGREQRELQDRETDAQEAREKLPPEPPLDADALTARQDALRAARGRLGEYESARQKHESLRGQINTLSGQSGTGAPGARPNLALLIFMVLSGVALVTAGALFGGEAMPVGVIGGLLLLGAAVALLYMGKPLPSGPASPVFSALGHQTAEAESAMETARESLLASGAALGLDGQPNSATLDSVEARLDSARNALSAWGAADEGLKGALRRQESQEGRVETAAEEDRSAVESLSEALTEWRVWLRDRALSETFTPNALPSFLAHVDAARELRRGTHQMRSRIAAIEHDIEEFRQQMEPLAVRHSLALDPADLRQLASTADQLITWLDEAKSLHTQREDAKANAEKERRQLELQDSRLRSAEEELAGLLTAGGTDDSEEFRRRARLHEERKERERERDEHRRSLERLSGPGKKFDAFRESLASSDLNKLQEEDERLSESAEMIDADRNRLREERGAIDNELDQLTGEEESSELRARRAILQERLREQAWEWSRLTLAELLLEKTRAKFERERQPSVIRHARDFFGNITGGRYNQLFAPIGEQTITVADASGAAKQPTQLSRGTREQLYLALRFGLIREFGEHAERLPVVVDEALVNFDPERAKLATQAFAQLAETNQVLVFTCHPATADMFADAGAQKVNISPRSF